MYDGGGGDGGDVGGCGGVRLFSVFYFGKVEGRVAQYPFVVCFGCQRWRGKGELSAVFIHTHTLYTMCCSLRSSP